MHNDLYIPLPCAGISPANERFLGRSTPPHPSQFYNTQLITAISKNGNARCIPADPIAVQHTSVSVRRFSTSVFESSTCAFGSSKDGLQNVNVVWGDFFLYFNFSVI
jgi:hypothetical protein